MSNKKTSIIYAVKIGFGNSAFLFASHVAHVRAQMSAVAVPSPNEDAAIDAAAAGDDFTWWYISLFVLTLGLAAAVYTVVKSKRAGKEIAKPKKTGRKEDWEAKSVDANKEMEWLRKNQSLIGKNGKNRAARNPARKNSLESQKARAEESVKDLQPVESGAANAQLPIFSVERIELARPFAPLAISNDEDLMSAVEQAHDEFEEDEAVRDLALRILQAFKTRNSVEALSQIALYDLSATLRSKAVTALADFNHESVFEFILLASADPTREVRAAAARSLSKLTFDRADAWTRIFETEETGRMRQAARAAIESGFVEMSFDRLVHPDKKYAYEAFALMVLLIKAEETEVIFEAIETHKNMNIRRALLHVIKITKDERAVEKLCALLENGSLPLELREEADKSVEEIGFVTA